MDPNDPKPNDPGTGGDPPKDPPKPAPAPGGSQQTDQERELDRLRNVAGQEKRRAELAEQKLQEIADASKSETEKLTEKATKADQLAAENTRLKTTLTAQVEAQKALLPEAMRDLIPAGDPAVQLDWITKANQAAVKMGGPQQHLPASGTRNPAGGAGNGNDAVQKDAAVKRFPALQRQRMS